MPAGGKHSTSLTLRERVEKLLFVFINLLKIPKTRVFRCTLHGDQDGGECELATPVHFVGANGITASLDGKRIYVNDPIVAAVTVFSRNADDGSLAFESRFDTHHNLDNIDMVQVGDDELLSCGSIPLCYTADTVCEEGLGKAEATVAGKITVGCGKSPGGLLLLDPSRSGAVVAEKNHDGSILSTVSSAVRVGDATLIGSPWSPGILLCRD